MTKSECELHIIVQYLFFIRI